jgi:hypothetical protein
LAAHPALSRPVWQYYGDCIDVCRHGVEKIELRQMFGYPAAFVQSCRQRNRQKIRQRSNQ